MKNVLKNRLMWLITVLTTVCSMVYIGMAVKENRSVAVEQSLKIDEIAILQNYNSVK